MSSSLIWQSKVIERTCIQISLSGPCSALWPRAPSFLPCVAVCALSVAQWCLTLYDPMDYIAHQAPLSREVSRQEYWSGFPFPPPGDLSRPRDHTCTSCISCLGRQILHHCATWEACFAIEVPNRPLPASAGDTVSMPDPWRSHMLRSTEPLHHSYWVCALEPQLLSPCVLEPVLCHEKPPQWESLTWQPESSPCSPELEKSLRSKGDLAQSKIISKST